MPISLKKLGFTTTIQEYFAEHYTRIHSNLRMNSKLPPDLVGGTKPKAFKIGQVCFVGGKVVVGAPYDRMKP